MLNNQRWGNQNKLWKKTIITIYSVYQTKLFLKSLKKIKLADLPYFLIIRCAIFLFIIHLIGKLVKFLYIEFYVFYVIYYIYVFYVVSVSLNVCPTLNICFKIMIFLLLYSQTLCNFSAICIFLFDTSYIIIYQKKYNKF